MRTQRQCYAILKKAIIDHGFEVRIYDRLVSPYQTPFVGLRIGEDIHRHECAFALHIVEGLGRDGKTIEMEFSGSCRIAGGRKTHKELMNMAVELRNGAKLIKFLVEQDLKYPDPEQK